MKRYLSLLALVIIPAISWSAEAAGSSAPSGAMMDKMKCCYMTGPVSAVDETWAARTDLTVNFGELPRHLKKERRAFNMYSVNTIQPIYRSQDMHNTFYGFAGVGLVKWKEHDTSWGAGLGYRHLTACGGHMFGIGAAYKDSEIRHVEFRGPGAYVEWLTQYTTVSLGRFWDRAKVDRSPWRHFLHHRRHTEVTGLDLSFQLPYLPWTQMVIGKTWYSGKIGHRSFHHFNHFHNWNLNRFDYGLKLNLIGCLSVEAGKQADGAYARIALSFGRPAVREYTLADGFLGSEAFTARDLRNYGLMKSDRFMVN
jgi:hypothetical protein